jgi:hypothetical protein
MKEKITLDRLEAKSLVFWATVGIRKSQGGSYSNTVINTIIKIINRFGKKYINQGSGMFLVGYECRNMGEKLANKLNSELGFRIKIKKEK